MIAFNVEQLLSMARSSEKRGDLEGCIAILRRIPIPQQPKEYLNEIAYRLGKERQVRAKFGGARELFAESARAHHDPAVRLLSQERCELLNRFAQNQRSAADLKNLVEIAQVKNASHLSPIDLGPEVDRVGCPAAYRSGYDREKGDPLSTLIRLAKHKVDKETLIKLGQYVAAYVFHVDQFAEADFVIPVPGDPGRIAERGYSIPAVLAEEVSRLCAIPLHEEFVANSGNGLELRTIARHRRAAAAEESYEVGKRANWCNGMTALIVDDVVTTGSTLKAVASRLRDAGTRFVYAVALAHTEGS